MAKKKSPKPKARLPRGFVDRLGADIRAQNRMLDAIASVYERYGFEPIETPMFEYTDALGKFLPDQDRPNEGVFSLQDDDEQWMSLRYDMTAPLARHVAENINEIALPYRTYRQGYVFRNEKPGPGRFRQFMQFDADTVGAPGPAADAEMCMMMADTMDSLGLEGAYVVRVNSRKVLDGLLDALNVTDQQQRLAVFRAADKLDRLGEREVMYLLGEGRLDESGDRTPGAGLDGDQRRYVMHLIVDKRVEVPDTTEPLETGLKELGELEALVRAAGYDEDRIRIDPSCVRGLEYYTGAVYECELTFPVTNERGETVTFGSVAGGGRYDGLVKRFTGQDVPATGFSIGVSRLQTALKNLGKLENDGVVAPVLVTVMDRDAEALAGYGRIVRDLREAGIRAEMYQGNPKQFGKQLQYADRRGAPVAIIQGAEEREQGIVQVKDLAEGKRLSSEIADNQAWRATRPAQVECKVEDVVAQVRSILQFQAEDGAEAGPA